MRPLIALLFVRLRAERGQALIAFVLLFTVFALAAAFTIDFGFWFSQRRRAQTDSDLLSLGGAYQLLDGAASFEDVAAAVQEAASANGVAPAQVRNLAVRSLGLPPGFQNDPAYCRSAPDTASRPNTVVLDVAIDSPALFASMFEVTAPDVGAHACAHLGSLRSTSGLRPWAFSRVDSECFDEGVPRFAAACTLREEAGAAVVAIRLGRDDGDSCSGPAGAVPYAENIIDGAGATCALGDVVEAEPGLNADALFPALAQLLSAEGACDALDGDGDGVDQFAEAFEPGVPSAAQDVTFVAKACATPRAVTVVVVDHIDGQGLQGVAIAGFAVFFVEQCEEVDSGGNVIIVWQDCDVPEAAREQAQVRGFFMRALVEEGEPGDLDEFGTATIGLIE